MTQVIRYTLEDYQRILQDGFDYSIPAYTNETIRALAEEVGAPTYIKTPEFFIKRQEEYDNINSTTFLKNRRNKKYKLQEITDDDWENIRVFQVTEMKEKSAYEKQLDTVRIILNRVTNDNLQDEILVLSQLFEEENNKNEKFINEVANLLIVFAISNTFYSNIYAAIFSKFMKEFSEWKNILQQNILNYKQSFNEMLFITAEKDYDKFCENNKINLNRRALSAFYSNLLEYGGIDRNIIFDILINIQDLLIKYSMEESKKEHVAEITENIIVILNIVWEKLNEHCSEDNNEKILIDKISKNLKLISSKKPLTKPYVSLTHKVIFRHLDLMKSLTII